MLFWGCYNRNSFVSSNLIYKTSFMPNRFLENSQIITYNTNEFSQRQVSNYSEIILSNNSDQNTWLNTYGLDHKNAFREVIKHNDLDDFLLKILEDDAQPTKLIELEDVLFISIQILRIIEDEVETEQMYFVSSYHYLWSIQEKPGDYFDWIRMRLSENQGLVRKKNTDYLLYLLLESALDHYQNIIEKYADLEPHAQLSDIKPTPEFTVKIEQRRQVYFELKKATLGLRDLLIKFDTLEMNEFEEKYFTELKEQAQNLNTEIDFELSELDSKLNLIFSLQGYRLNEVMKTLTIFSVIFIPITFIAGVYGMNFKYMPELQSANGYFITLAVMLLLAMGLYFYFKNQNWFD